MGSREVSDFPELVKDKTTESLSDAELFRKLCPYYLAMGMTADEYWNKEPELCVYYRDAQRLKRQQAEEEAWMHGFYTYVALMRTSPLFRDLVKNGKPEPYFEKPVGFYEPTEEAKKQEEVKKELSVRDKLDEWIAKVNRSKKKKEETNGR